MLYQEYVQKKEEETQTHAQRVFQTPGHHVSHFLSFYIQTQLNWKCFPHSQEIPLEILFPCNARIFPLRDEHTTPLGTP